MEIANSEIIAPTIILLRNKRVMLDFQLASVYGVETKLLKRAVKRNIERFPLDFMFELTKEETENLRYQFGTSSWGGNRYLPYAFTEHGAIMLASVLNSANAIKMSIEVVRAFAKLRELASHYQELSDKIGSLEQKYDAQFKTVFDAIKQLMQQPELLKPERELIGFKTTTKH